MKPVCLITGAGGRLGTALCRLLSGSYEIIAQYRERLPDVSSQLRRALLPRCSNRLTADSECAVYCVNADLTRREDILRLVEVSLARHERIDCVINCAADIRFHGKLLELWQSDDYAHNQLNINCVAPIRLVSLIHDLCWKDQPVENAKYNRSIVNVSSGSGLYVFRNTEQAYYGASKAALNLLTMYLALELAPYSVRANCVCPGRFADDLSTQKVAETITRLLKGNMTGEVVLTV